MPMTDAFDEFGLLDENAAEAGLSWAGRPPVRRVGVELPDGRRQSALVWGAGDPDVVLLHGGAQNAHTWDTVALALGRPLVAIDLAGHGHSDWRPEHDYSPENLADDIAVTMAALAPRAGLVVGMSLGGLTALALSSRHPDTVGRLVLVDVTPGVNAEKAKAIIDFVVGPETFSTFDEILARTVQHNPTRSESSLRRGVIHNAMQRPDGTWTWRWDPTRRVGIRRDATFEDVSRLWSSVAASTAPLLLVRGGISPVVGDEDVDELRRLRPDARVVTVEGAGHSVQGDRPVELAEIIAAEADTAGAGRGG